MRLKIIGFLKCHPRILNFFYAVFGVALNFLGLFVRKKKKIVFASYGGRKLDDSPYVLYKEICGRKEFDDYELIWAFVDPDAHELKRGRKVKIDTPAFFMALLSAKIWISNTGIDRDVGISKKRVISIETWHGCPLKKICGEEHTTSMQNDKLHKGKKDASTIRCAQSEHDLEIFARVFNAEKEAFLLSDLPRNDELVGKKTVEEINAIKAKLNIPTEKKVILYMPTYREYLVDESYNNYIKPPMTLTKWAEALSDEYVLLFRAHYAVNKALDLKNDGFVFDVSSYPRINELYIVSDILISDYSSAYMDYAILERPMLCFAYDLEEYEEKRGLYLKLDEALPCEICDNEDALISQIVDLNYEEASAKTRIFKERFAPFAGNASKTVVEEIVKRL